MSGLNQQQHTAAFPRCGAVASWFQRWAGLLLTACGFMAA